MLFKYPKLLQTNMIVCGYSRVFMSHLQVYGAVR